MNTHQQQLLQLLKIKFYQLHADFSVCSTTGSEVKTNQASGSIVTDPDHKAPTNVKPTASASDTTSLHLSMKSSGSAALQQLQHDIQLLLQTELPAVDWQPSAAHSACQWREHIFQTPEIQAFCSAGQKKQLWLEFIKAQDQVDGSSHSSSHPS